MSTATANGAVLFSSLVQTALLEQPDLNLFSSETETKVQKIGNQYPESVKFLRIGSPTVADLTGTYPVLGAGTGDTLARSNVELKIKKAGISGANSIRIQNIEEKFHGMTVQSALVQTAKEALMNDILKDIFTRMIRQKDKGNTDYGGEALDASQHVAWATAGTAANADWLAARAFLNNGNVPKNNRYMAFFTDEYADFLADPTLKPWFQYQNMALGGGVLPTMVHGFKPVETVSLPLIKPSTGTLSAAAATFTGTVSANDTRHSMLAWAKEMVGLLIAGVETAINPIPGGGGDFALEYWVYYYGGVLNKAGVYHTYDSTAN